MDADFKMDISLSRIAHDLRGPLMPLRTAAWLLRQEPGASARVHELVDIIDRQSVRLSRMMDELSDWAHTTVESTSLSCVPMEVALVLDMAIGSVSDCHVDPVVTDEAKHFPLHADPHRLGQLLRTLIEHATHRDPGNHPEVVVSVVYRELHIQVRDHGDPLDESTRSALLTRPQPSAFDDGLGLRLLLASKIAQAHGGRLSVDNRVQDGLAFTCSLPQGTVVI